MKFTLPLIVLAAAANAWELTINLVDGGHVTTHGTQNSGCVTYGFDLSKRKTNRAIFSGSTFADTFELYAQKDCKGSVSYREGGGSHAVTPARIIQSYKVY